jgi:Flp pilus assembly protein TadG
MRVRLRVQSIHRDERGVTIAFVAIIIFVLIGVVALSVDFGALYFDRRRMVNAADAAALAAALTYAKKDAQCGTNDAPAQTQANSLATANTSPAKPDDRQGQNPYIVDCAKKSVTVQYYLTHNYFFATAIGFDSTPVVSRATGHWGPAGGAGDVLPVMLSMGRLSTCEIPGTEEGKDCYFYVDNSALGNASWALMNVQPTCADSHYGWNVNRARCPSKVGLPDPWYTCPSFSDAEMIDLINNGSVPLTINYPGTTYVCNSSGNRPNIFRAIDNLGGKTRLFAVNDPSKQILKGGIPAPPPATPDFFDIVGFIQMKIVDVWRGNDAQWDVANCPGPKNQNAYCLHAVWLGYTFEPGPICENCQDFGVGVVVLKG